MKRAGEEGGPEDAKRNRSSMGDDDDMMEDAPEIRPEDEDDWDDDTEAYLAAMGDSVRLAADPVSPSCRAEKSLDCCLLRPSLARLGTEQGAGGHRLLVLCDDDPAFLPMSTRLSSAARSFASRLILPAMESAP
jgi:hypothetical protein